MNQKNLFMEAYYKKQLKEFFKGTEEYMIYPEDAAQFIDKRKLGSGNLMYHAFKFYIIPSCKENSQLKLGNIIIDTLNEMVLSNDIEEFHASVLATSTILENNMENDLDLSLEKFEKLLTNIKTRIYENKEFLSKTPNFYGNISFYEEFLRIDNTMENGKHIL